MATKARKVYNNNKSKKSSAPTQTPPTTPARANDTVTGWSLEPLALTRVRLPLVIDRDGQVRGASSQF